MADPNMTSVNIPRATHKRLKLLRKKTRLPVGVMAELAIEEYVHKANSAPNAKIQITEDETMTYTR